MRLSTCLAASSRWSVVLFRFFDLDEEACSSSESSTMTSSVAVEAPEDKDAEVDGPATGSPLGQLVLANLNEEDTTGIGGVDTIGSQSGTSEGVN
jgi:hypothetical protein